MRALEQRVKGIDAQRAAYLELSAKILRAKSAVAQLGKLSLFRKFSASSSDERALLATAGESARAGSYSFRVRTLATNHAVFSRGFADADRTSVGAGSLTIESGRGRVDRETDLDQLNGAAGVRRGVLRITDRSGASADIDLSTAVTVADVLEAINSNALVDVRASVTGLSSDAATGDRIVIEDLTGQTEGPLIIADRSGGFVAQDLGIAGSVAGARLDGRDLVRLTDQTALSTLNDGNGVDRAIIGTDDDLLFTTSYGEFGVSLSSVLSPRTDLRQLNNGNGVRLGVIRVTDRSGKSAEIDLSAARTVEDVRKAIDDADVAVSVAIVNSNLLINDTSETPAATANHLKIEDVSGFAAADLGIAQNVAANSITGREIFRVSTLGDMVRAINFATGNNSFVEASISGDGKGLTLRSLGLENNITVSAVGESGAAADLGLLDGQFSGVSDFKTRRLVAGLNTVLLKSLKGGAGVEAGVLRFTDRAGIVAEIDFTSAQTLQDVVDLINLDPNLALTAATNRSGTGIALRDDSGETVSPLIIEDVSGTLALDLGIALAADAESGTPITAVDGGNLQLQYISRATRLADLIGHADFRLGEFQITDSSGATHIVGLAVNLTTVGEVIDAINLRTPDTIEARINDTGDGILIVDRSEGSGTLKVQDINGGQVAKNLRLAGNAAPTTNFVDGTLERRIQVDAGDTLQDVVAKLNATGSGLSASVLNDGRTSNAFSLVIASGTSGRRGELLIDSKRVNLDLQTLVRAQDAVLTLGAGTGAAPLVVTSSTNTVESLVPGVRLELLSPSDRDVSVTVDQDVDAIVEGIRDFVEAFNEVHADIDDKTSFNVDTLERGLLLGDSTINTVRDRLNRSVSQGFRDADPSFARLLSVGVRIGQNYRLVFDEERFRDVYAANPAAVEELFATEATGAGDALEDALTELTRDTDGVLARRDEALSGQQEILNERIVDLNVLLDGKRRRLESQFAALESVLAGLQAQQSALADLQRLLSR